MHAGLLQHRCTFVERRPCGSDVVDQHDDPVNQEGRSRSSREHRRESECAPQVSAPPRGGQSSLRERCSRSPQRVHDWHAERGGKIRRLIESAVEAPPRVQRHGDDAVGIRQQIVSRLSQQRTQLVGQSPPPFIFEGVDDLSQRRLVLANGTPSIERAWPSPARGATLHDNADGSPGRKGIATRAAQGRRDRSNRAPAGVTHRTIAWRAEHGRARGARRRQDDADERITCDPHETHDAWHFPRAARGRRTPCTRG